MRRAAKQTEFDRKMRLKAKCLSYWAMQWMALEKTRRQESLSQKMHDDRFLGTYLRVWVAKMRKTVLKRHLGDLAKVAGREKRNRIFLKWLCAVRHKEITEELSARLLARHKNRVAAGTLQALKLNAMRRQRERLISKIIFEKRYQLLAMRTLDQWRNALQENLYKN